MNNEKFVLPKTRFANPTADTVFKRIFGSYGYKLATIGLIKGILGLDIEDVTFIRNELTKETEDSRGAFIDVLARCQDGSLVLVEMQNSRQRYFLQRMIYYSSKLISTQGDTGEWDYNIDRTYVIAFLNFDIRGLQSGVELDKEAPDRYVYTYETREVNTGVLMPNSTTYKVLMLEKFDKKLEELSSYPEKLLYLLQNAQHLNEAPQTFQEDPYLKVILEASDRASFTKEQELQYVKDMMNQWDIINAKKLAVEEAVEKNTADIAKAMLAEGVPVETVALCTKLDIETVKKLASKD